MINFQNSAVAEEKYLLENSLADFIPYVDIVDNKIFFEDNSTGIVFRISLIYDEILGDGRLSEYETKLNTFLNTIDANVTFQFIFKKTDYFDDILKLHYEQNESQNELIKTMFNDRVEHIKHDKEKRNLFRYNLYCVFVKKYEFAN